MNVYILLILIMLGGITVLLLLVLLKLVTVKGKDTISSQALNAMSDLGSLKTLLSSVENNQRQYNQALQTRMEHALRSIENIRQSHEDFKHREQENRESLKRLETVIAGTKSKGIAGENILREALSSFPPKMVHSNVRIKGKEVEFALALANNKLMPIDSKWPSTDLLEEYSKQQDNVQRDRILNQIQREILKRVDEASQYIDPEMTTPWAIAAIPDSAFALCKSTHFDAYKKNVILISYSMIAPYLLMFFSLHLQYCSSVDLENLMHYLLDIKRHTEKMSEILENKIYRAATMLTNASDEYRQIIGMIKGSLSTIESYEKK